jgi:Domain of unknown function DUF11
VAADALPAPPGEVVQSSDASGEPGWRGRWPIAFSPDGTKLALVSGANNLVPGASGGDDVYVADLPTGQLTRVGGPVSDLGGVSYPITYAPDGNGVAFVTGEPQPGVDDANGSTDIYLAAVEWPDLSVTMTASPSPIPAGGMLAYEVGVTNDGADPAPDAESVVVLPPEVTVVDAGPCDVAAGAPRMLRCPLGDVAPGGTEVFAIGVTVDASPGDRLEAVVAVDSGSHDCNRADDLASAVVTVAEPSS